MSYNEKPDFERYSTEELRRVLTYIDRETYPERLEEVRRILLSRETDELTREAIQSTLDEAPANNARLPKVEARTSLSREGSRKPPTVEKRAASFAGALMELVFAAGFLLVVINIFRNQEDPVPWWYAVAFVAVVIGFVGDALLRFVSMFRNAGNADGLPRYTNDSNDPMAEYLQSQDKRR